MVTTYASHKINKNKYHQNLTCHCTVVNVEEGVTAQVGTLEGIGASNKFTKNIHQQKLKSYNCFVIFSILNSDIFKLWTAS